MQLIVAKCMISSWAYWNFTLHFLYERPQSLLGKYNDDDDDDDDDHDHDVN